MNYADGPAPACPRSDSVSYRYIRTIWSSASCFGSGWPWSTMDSPTMVSDPVVCASKSIRCSASSQLLNRPLPADACVTSLFHESPWARQPGQTCRG